MVNFKVLHRLFGKIRMKKKAEENDNSLSRGGQSPRGSIWRNRSFASPTNGSRSNRSGRKVRLLTVISSLFKTSNGKPMSNDGGKDDEPQVEKVLNATIDDVIECDSYGSLSSLSTSSTETLKPVVENQQQNTEEVNKVVTQPIDWELLTEDNFGSHHHGEIKLAAAGDLKQITRKGNDVGKDDDVNFWKRYMLAVCIVFVLLLLI